MLPEEKRFLTPQPSSFPYCVAQYPRPLDWTIQEVYRSLYTIQEVYRRWYTVQEVPLQPTAPAVYNLTAYSYSHYNSYSLLCLCV